MCRTRAHQGHLAVEASGSVPDTPLTKGYQTWRWVGDQACCFLASLGFPFALRGYANEGISYEAPRPVSAEVQVAQVWDPRHVTMCLSVAGVLCCMTLVASHACTFLDPCLVKAVSRSCGIEGCWNKSLNRLLLN
jgi:hypothetical protein